MHLVGKQNNFKNTVHLHPTYLIITFNTLFVVVLYFNMQVSILSFQTKYTLIDEQDIPLVENYAFEVNYEG